jgi:RNA-directed DNA polymerase
LEPEVERVFHPDSYGYRPRRSAHDALRTCRTRCWKYDWAIDLDLRAFFDSLDHSLVLRSVAHHTNLRWILLYVERWLKAPLRLEDGTLQSRDRGSPQGSAISPVLANLFLHYALDMWLVREFPDVPFERYADDEILHCKTQQQAELVLDAIIERLAQVGLELNLDKTRIVYCKDANRTGSHEHEQFTFLGYTFRPRRAQNRSGELFDSFCPAVSNDAAQEMRRRIRRWRLNLCSGDSLADLAEQINPTVRGWINFYGCFYQSKLVALLENINEHLVRWAMRKFKRLRGRARRARRLLAVVAAREPDLFAHWGCGARPLAG